ncbi:hypothetical protein V491_02151 [Pseudogymnoascus sp. VKM F-3775]|nr:hypothetical protein V491_02151 [Pseudogymnoascus sp. VKM F-3775]
MGLVTDIVPIALGFPPAALVILQLIAVHRPEAKDLRKLVRQGERKSEVDERIAALVSEQREQRHQSPRELSVRNRKGDWGKISRSSPPPVRGAGYEPSASSGEPTGVAYEGRDTGGQGNGDRYRERG